MQQPKVSIIVPCYNQAEYLDECLQSVLNQTYHNWECIIVDDGSPDNTEEVAQHWVKKDHRFNYYRKENGGVASARNFGIEMSKGEWILPLDGDDKIGEKYLELATEEFPKADLIYSKALFFGNLTEPFSLSDFSFEILLLKNLIFCTAFYKKEAWEKTCGYDTKLIHGFEDWDFWIELLKNSHKRVIRLDYVGFYYRRKDVSRDVNINKNNDLKKAAFNYIFLKHHEEYFKTYGSYFDLVYENKKLTEIVNEPISRKIVRKFKK